MVSERASERTFVGVSALLFAASAAGTIVWRAAMPAMDGIDACRHQASQPTFTLRQARLTTSLPTAPWNSAAGARCTRGVLVPAPRHAKPHHAEHDRRS
jgi:CheY-like chemotaxis protein